MGSWKGPPAAHKMTGDRQVSPSTHLWVLRATYTGQTLETSRRALHFSDDTDLRDASWAWRWDPTPVTSLRYSDTKRKRASGLRPPLATALSPEPNNTVLIMPKPLFYSIRQQETVIQEKRAQCSLFLAGEGEAPEAGEAEVTPSWRPSAS